jgi:LysR family transcriptional regulator, glycine cleavage system transcriptional activator
MLHTAGRKIASLSSFARVTMRLPSTRVLKAFQLAAQTGSFKIAAAQLFLTPSAVSYQIKGLEEELGVQLFRRGVRTLTLTDAGACYLAEIDVLFERLESATRDLRTRFRRGSLRLRVVPLFANEFLLPRIARLHQAQPQIDLQIETERGTEIHPKDADISIVFGAGSWDGLTSHRLFAQNYVPACAPGLLAGKSTLTIEELNTHTLLEYEEHKDAWRQWAESAGFEPPRPRNRIRFDSMMSMVHAAERSAGIALVPAPLTADRFRRQALAQPFREELATSDCYFLVHRPDEESRPEVGAFVSWIVSELPRTEAPSF